jgi:hypothetical protein
MAADSCRRAPAVPGRRLAWIGLSIVASVAACDVPAVSPSSVSGYDAFVIAADTLGNVRHLFYHWPVGRAIAIYVDTATEPTGTDLRADVARGIAQWKATVYFRELDAKIVGAPEAADVIVHYVTAPIADSVSVCSTGGGPAGGITFFCASDALDSMITLPLASGAGGHVKMDVTVDRTKAPTEARFQSLVTHELGHVFGIGMHSGDPTDLMFGAPTAAGPTSRDGETLRFVLHQPIDLRP